MKSRPGRWGFSLIEVVIGIFILLVVLVSVAAVFSLQERAFHKYRDNNMVEHVARSEMERLLAFGFSEIPDQLSSFPRTVMVERLTNGNSSFANYIVNAEFTPRPDDDTAEVVVVVRHQDKSEVRIELRTAVYRTS